MNRQLKQWSLVLVLALASSVGAWAAYSAVAGPQQNKQARFAGSMPAGALVYLEARDLAGLMKAWVASPTRGRYYDSASYRSFKRSRLYLKLQDRLSDLQRGFGFEITEERLAALSGGPSAISIYDPGKLEVLLTTEMSRERALTTFVFAEARNFEERRTPKGALYYAREVSSDGDRLVQRIAFAHNNGQLWIGTSESLLAEALDGPANGGLGAPVAETIKASGDFDAHDLMIWFDMDRVARNKYFNLYWIQKNASDLAGISSGIVDLEFARDGVHERRWYVRREPSTATAAEVSAFAALRGMAPGSSQFIDVKAADDRMRDVLAETMFGVDRTSNRVTNVGFQRLSNPFDDESESSDESDGPVSGQYRYLDERFDKDVDDPSAARPVAQKKAIEPAPVSFGSRLGTVLGEAAPVRYAAFGSIDLPEGKVFASFERSVVVELGSPERFDATGFERLVTEEFGRRFIVGGDTSSVVWKDEAGGARAISGALIPQGGAYRIGGKYLVIAKDAAHCSAILELLGGPRTGGVAFAAPKGSVVRVSEVRLSNARESFARLTNILDTGAATTISEDVSGEEEGDSRPVMFFSENLTSLLTVARDVTTVRIVTAEDGNVLRERVDYLWTGM